MSLYISLSLPSTPFGINGLSSGEDFKKGKSKKKKKKAEYQKFYMVQPDTNMQYCQFATNTLQNKLFYYFAALIGRNFFY